MPERTDDAVARVPRSGPSRIVRGNLGQGGPFLIGHSSTAEDLAEEADEDEDDLLMLS